MNDEMKELIYERTCYIYVHPDAQMCMPNPWSDGSVEWHLRHGDAVAVRISAATLISSYDYLLSDCITTKEAVYRLRVLRNSRKRLIEKGNPAKKTKEVNAQ